MSERYSRLFSLTENLYSEGSPVAIAAGALLKDNQTGKVLVQLKFRSLSSKFIKAVTVTVTPKDVVGVMLEQVSHRYLDLDAERGAEFCQKMPVLLPNAETRAFEAAVTEVVFSDGSIWTASGAPWEPLPAPVSVATGRDDQLVKQYQLEYGENNPYLLKEYKDLWFCTCGAVNKLGTDTVCHSCRKSLLELRSLNWEELEAHKNARLAEEAAKAEEARLAAEAQAEKQRAAAEAAAKKFKKLAAIVLPSLAVIIAASVLITGSITKRTAYNEAMALAEAEKYAEAAAMLEEAGYDNAENLAYGSAYQAAKALFEAGDYEAAQKEFEKLGDYSDSAEREKEAADHAEEARCQAAYEQAEELLAQGDTAHAAMAFYEIADYKDAKERSFALWNELLRVPKTIDGGTFYCFGVQTDGTVTASRTLTRDGTVVSVFDYQKHGQEKVSDWENIVEVSANTKCTFGLREDGTVAFAGDEDFCYLHNVPIWADIVGVSAGGSHVVGLKNDGTAVAFGLNVAEVFDWTDLVAVSAGYHHTVGLKADGTVVATGDNILGGCNVSEWKDIVAISAGCNYTIGLKADGTVVAAGDNNAGKSNVSDWTDIVAIATGEQHTVGLKADGTVVATGLNDWNQCEVSDMKDIKEVFAWGLWTVGLKADGTVVGNAPYNWNNIKLP